MKELLVRSFGLVFFVICASVIAYKEAQSALHIHEWTQTSFPELSGAAILMALLLQFPALVLFWTACYKGETGEFWRDDVELDNRFNTQ